MQVLVLGVLLTLYCAATCAELDAAHFSKAAVAEEGRDLLTAGMFFKTEEASAIPEGRGLLDSRRELRNLPATACAVRNFNVLSANCHGNTPIPACCNGKGKGKTCATNNNGAGGQCPSSSYLGCCPA